MGISVKQAKNISSVLSEGLPYIQRFKGKIIVLKYGGAAMSEQNLKRNFHAFSTIEISKTRRN